jgi:hypothetical protein
MELLGPKTAEDLAPKKKPPAAGAQSGQTKDKKAADRGKNKGVTVNGEASGGGEGDANKETAQTIAELMRSPAMTSLHAPGKNHTTDGYVVTSKTPELLAAHLKVCYEELIQRTNLFPSFHAWTTDTEDERSNNTWNFS